MKKNTALYGVLTALAIILSYLEMLIPIPVPIVGIKLGLSNIISVFLLYKKGIKPAFFVLFSRIIIINILFGSLSSFIFAICGGVASLVVMVVLKGFNKFSSIGVSAVGGVVHNVVQILVATVYLCSTAVLGYLPVLVIVGVISGIIVGIVSNLMFRIKV